MPDPSLLHPPIIDPRAVYTSAQLERLLDVGSTTLHRARKAGDLRGAKKGRSVVYLGEWIIDWLRADAGGPDAL